MEILIQFFWFIAFPGAMSGGFNFQVNDGVNFTPRQIFSITAQALVLSLEKNRPLKVFPGKSILWVEPYHLRIKLTLFYILITNLNKTHEKN